MRRCRRPSYLGCKQNLGSPVNDRFKLRTEGQLRGPNFQSAAVKVATSLETLSREGIQCRHGVHEDEQPVPQNEPIWSRSERAIARTAFDAALGRELHDVIQEAKQMANEIQTSSDVWDLEHHLTQRRKEIDRKYDFGNSRLTQLFGRLLHERRLSERELRGLREDKLKSIRSFPQILSRNGCNRLKGPKTAWKCMPSK